MAVAEDTPIPGTDPKLFARFMAKVNKTDGCWLWTAASYVQTGYGCFSLPGRVRTTAQRAAWLLFIGPIPDGLWVLHTCDVRKCVRRRHLFLGTNQENVNDCVGKGRHSRGARHGRSKLGDEDVLAIRAATGTQAEISGAFGLSRGHVSAIRGRRVRTHLP